ncbi:MAG TPA: type VI secretion system tube protein Hcp [Candidatus Angelobacter sp.]
MNQRTRYALLGMFLAPLMTGAMFSQGTNSPQGAPATKFGLPAAKPATGAAAPFPATTTAATSTAATAATNAKTAATSAFVSTNVPTALKVSAASVVFTQQGASKATTIPCSKFVLNINASVAGGAVAGRPTWVVTFTKPWDSAPDPFVTAVVNGAHFDSMSFTFLGPAGGQPVSGVTLTSVFVGSVNKYFDAATGSAMEEISLVPKAINWGKSSNGPTGTTFTDAWSAAN